MTLLQSVKRQALLNGIELKLHQGEYTRKTAAIISTLSLIKQGKALDSQSINNECFDLLYFTLSNNKTQGKSKSNMLKRRLPKYISNHLFSYDAISDLVTLSDTGKAKLLKGKRVSVTLSAIAESVKRVHAKKLKALQSKCSFKGRKTILTKADSTHISNMLYNHLLTA